MITLSEINQAIDWIEHHPIIGAALIASVAYTAKGISQTVFKRLSAPSDYARPIFWTLGAKYRVTAIHQYFPSDDPSGYKQVQNSRPDQWQQLVTIKSSFMRCRHRIIPHDPSYILAVIISRNGVEREKVISFNK